MSQRTLVSVIDEFAHMSAENQQLAAENEQLKADNERLRQVVRQQNKQITALEGRIGKLAEEEQQKWHKGYPQPAGFSRRDDDSEDDDLRM